MVTTAKAPRLLVLIAASAAIAAAFILLVRPWYQRWGATEEEIRHALPGDEILPTAVSQETRAITIDAPVERVWPWVAQLGQDRGGFYSFDLLENLVGCEMPTKDILRPDRQSWRIGDRLWMYPPEKAEGAGFATLRVYVPGRALGFGAHGFGTPPSIEDGSWSFVLEPIDGSRARLLVRGRIAGRGRSWIGRILDRSVFEPAHFVMERRTLIGIKQLAEGRDRGRSANHVQIVLWTITFGLLITALVQVLLRRKWVRPLAAFVTAAAVFQILTLRQPPILVGAALTGLVSLILLWPESSLRARSRSSLPQRRAA